MEKAKVFFLLGLLVLFPSLCYGATASYSSNGNAFRSASGQYATSNFCSDQVCGWISGNQVILGANSSDPSTWTGGSATWSFPVDVLPRRIASASLKISWPASYGKGLHSLVKGSSAVVTVGSQSIATPKAASKCQNLHDYFAFPCGSASATFNIPPNLIQANTQVSISVPSQTLWDIGKVTLTVRYGSGSAVEIFNGKIYVRGKKFMVKGIDYAPWLPGTGPDPTQGQKPFPASASTDVTALLKINGKVCVKDYEGDKRIQAAEVIRNDIETMKKLGINTLRLYAVAPWHDKNLNGRVDRSTDPTRDEIVQGDLPDWAVKYILNLAHANGMMVIMGYWVQEEDFEASPPVCDGNDLAVAKQALGRVIKMYKSNPAVLAWGIGNEVNGSWNQSWFSWGVQPNDYLNALFAYARTLDTGHPVMYAKYVGEQAGFDELDADIIAVNTYVNPASVVAGEFTPPAASGQAYLLGEFGQDLSQVQDDWTLATQYAGGCFLEFNNVWWKGDGQNLLGVVDEYRCSNTLRSQTLEGLYSEVP